MNLHDVQRLARTLQHIELKPPTHNITPLQSPSIQILAQHSVLRQNLKGQSIMARISDPGHPLAHGHTCFFPPTKDPEM